MTTQTWQQDNFTISTDKTSLDTNVIHEFLTNSYWAQGITLNEVTASIENSFCFGLYDGHQQIGFARIITDFIRFAYLCDVFVLPSHQGRGLGKWFINIITNLSELKNIKTWMLGTKDAHDLYKKVGFKPCDFPEKLMVRKIAE